MKKIITLMLVAFLLNSYLLNAQEPTEKKCNMPFKLNVGADIMSRYVWRGLDYGGSPSIQPTLSFGLGDFEIGYWGAIALANNYVETDLYAKYTIKGFSVILTDYYIPALASNVNDTRFSYCKNPDKIDFDTTTGENLNKYSCHSLEATLQYKGPEKFPVSILVGTFVYGNDKSPQDTVFTPGGSVQSIKYKNRFSTYIELGYPFTIKDFNFDIFVGATPFSSVYSTPAYDGGFAVVNTGITGYKSIKISENFSLPLKASLIFNPQTSGFHFVFGLTL
ncbi:MAG TPA: hypothetical protein PKW80_07810 [Bacteroidales bacterium]|nr:hypothetical protein [Bacteroidales bacterium]